MTTEMTTEPSPKPPNLSIAIVRCLDQLADPQGSTYEEVVQTLIANGWHDFRNCQTPHASLRSRAYVFANKAKEILKLNVSPVITCRSDQDPTNRLRLGKLKSEEWLAIGIDPPPVHGILLGERSFSAETEMGLDMTRAPDGKENLKDSGEPSSTPLSKLYCSTETINSTAEPIAKTDHSNLSTLTLATPRTSRRGRIQSGTLQLGDTPSGLAPRRSSRIRSAHDGPEEEGEESLDAKAGSHAAPSASAPVIPPLPDLPFQNDARDSSSTLSHLEKAFQTLRSRMEQGKRPPPKRSYENDDLINDPGLSDYDELPSVHSKKPRSQKTDAYLYSLRTADELLNSPVSWTPYTDAPYTPVAPKDYLMRPEDGVDRQMELYISARILEARIRKIEAETELVHAQARLTEARVALEQFRETMTMDVDKEVERT